MVCGDRLMEIGDLFLLSSHFSFKGLPRVMSMMDLLGAWDDVLPLLSLAATFLTDHPDATDQAIPLKKVSLLPPILGPGKVINTGLNSYDHAREMGMSIPSQGFQPNFFFKGDRCCLIGPGQKIRFDHSHGHSRHQPRGLGR